MSKRSSKRKAYHAGHITPAPFCPATEDYFNNKVFIDWLRSFMGRQYDLPNNKSIPNYSKFDISLNEFKYLFLWAYDRLENQNDRFMFAKHCLPLFINGVNCIKDSTCFEIDVLLEDSMIESATGIMLYQLK